MIKNLLSLILVLVVVVPVAAQTEAKEHIIRGNNLYLQKDFEKAELQYKQALSKDSNSIKANYNLGNALYQQGKFDEARTHYQRVLNNPEATTEQKEMANYNMGRSYLDERKFDNAEYYFKESLKLNPKDENARKNYNLAKKEIHPEDLQSQGGEKNQKNTGTAQNKEKDKESDQDIVKKEDDKGAQNQDGKNGEEEGSGEKPQEHQITKGSDGKGEEAPEAQTNEIHENVLKGLEQQEQETLKKIISQKAKKVRTKTEKDW